MIRLVLCVLVLVSPFAISEDYVFKAGDTSLQKWLLPEQVPYPADNEPNEARISLGKKLFFDPRLSGDGNMSCASCHNPMLGWSDGFKTAKGHESMVLGRATPTIINTGYNSLQMWDGRKATLEDQATGPLEAEVEMHTNMDMLMTWLKENEGYRTSFELAYPNEGVNEKTLAKAIANYERTIVSRTSPFDKWVAGDENAMTAQEISGFKLFVDPNKGNCEVCHSAPNFTDNGFHNVGLSNGDDLGRHGIIPLKSLKGAFKTPTLRDISYSAPYFHNGEAADLKETVEHYINGWEGKEHVSMNIKRLNLTDQEIDDLVAFMKALSSPKQPLVLPELP